MPKRIRQMIPTEERLDSEIQRAKLARLRAEAKLRDTERQGVVVRRVASDAERLQGSEEYAQQVLKALRRREP